MLASESHLIANHTVIAMLALCTLGMAFLFRIVIASLVNQRLKGRRRTTGLGVQRWLLPIRLEQNATRLRGRKVVSEMSFSLNENARTKF